MRYRSSRKVRMSAILSVFAWISVVTAPFAATGNDADPGLREGIGLFEALQFDAAVDALSKELDGGQLSESQRAHAEIYKGLAFLARGEKVKGWKAFIRALQADPGVRLDPDLASPWAQSLFSNARGALPVWKLVMDGAAAADAGNCEQGIALCDRALSSGALIPEVKALVYGIRGKALLDAGRLREAAADLSRAIALYPDHADFYNDRGLAWSRLGRRADAIADHDRAIELDPRDDNSYNNRGTIYLDAGDGSKALADFARAVSLSPRSDKAYNNRAAAYLLIKDYPRALEDTQRALELNPRSAAAFNNRGLVFSNTRQYGKALEDFNRAVELNPANSSAYYNRGVVYREKGMFREAAADMERYCALVPADTAAKRELEKMREKAR